MENGLDLDAVAVLQLLEGPAALVGQFVAVYVQSQDNLTIGRITDGVYDLYFTLGEDWDADEGAFTRNTRRSRFDEPFPFTTTATQYTGWSVTLHGVAGGTADTEPVPEDAFPDLK